MIKVYIRIGCTSCYNTIDWFEKYKIKIKIIDINDITKRDLITALSYTTNGTRDLVKQRNRVTNKSRNKLKLLNEMNFNEGLCYLKSNTDILRSPIVLDKEKIVVGYNRDELRMFLSPEYKKCIIH
ncbi:ArsC/Spx/MgsR family protein [Lactococcus petauri]|uniref:ArsC/Spx/MgsR family protein n=1 Tax=Lactococcus petauri TaxID=1940789 RepID=UPI0038537A00